MNIKNSSLSAKLMLGFGVVLGLLVVLMAVYQVTVTSVTGGYGDLLGARRRRSSARRCTRRAIARRCAATRRTSSCART